MEYIDHNKKNAYMAHGIWERCTTDQWCEMDLSRSGAGKTDYANEKQLNWPLNSHRI